MKTITSMLISLIFVVGTIAEPAMAANLARFHDGIGVIPTGSTNTNVRGVPAAGQIWRIRELTATVQDDGSIQVVGMGLLLAAGNAVGSNANAKVFATLFCANDGNLEHSSSRTPGVALETDGDFMINDTLSPAPPSTCDSPVLLIRNAGNGGWFAAGVPSQ
jgi:hypothetical protein